MNKLILKSSIIFIILSVYVISKPQKIQLKPLPDDKNPKVYEQKWKKYGAYYDKDELIVTSTNKRSDMYTVFEIYKKIKILTVSGAEHGTVPIHQWAKRITQFELKHYNAQEEEIPVPVKKIVKEYKESGKIIFPKVTKGSTLIIKIKFQLDNRYYTFFESWLYHHQIPIRRRRVVFAYTKNCEYICETYGSRYAIRHLAYANKDYKLNSYLIHNYEPRPEIDYLDFWWKTEPRVVCRLTKFHPEKVKTSDLKQEIFRWCKEEIGEISSALVKEIFKDTLLKHNINNPDTLTSAKNILNWVQKNGYSAGANNIIDNRIFSRRKASHLNVTSLCYKMLKHVGIKSEILLTPRKNQHFQKEMFLLYASSFYGFLALNINNMTYVAYPYACGYELGEYPLGYKDALYMGYADTTINQLPKPLWGEKCIKDRMILDFSSSPGEYTLVREYQKNSASRYRSKYLYKNKNEQRKSLENLIQHFGKSNSIESFSFENLNNSGMPLIVRVKFKSDLMPVPYKNRKIYQLNNFYYSYFSDISLERQEDVHIHYKSTYTNELEVKKMPAKKIIADIYSKQISNRLFDVNYSELETDSSFIFNRVLTFDKNHIRANEIKDVYQDCVELNKIEDSHIAIVE